MLGAWGAPAASPLSWRLVDYRAPTGPAADLAQPACCGTVETVEPEVDGVHLPATGTTRSVATPTTLRCLPDWPRPVRASPILPVAHPSQGTNVKLIVSSLSCPPPFREHPSSPHRAQPSGPSIEREMQIRADQGAPAAVGQGGAGPRMSRTGLPAGVGSRGPTIQLGPGYIPEIAAPFFLPNSDKIGIFGTHRVCETNP